MDEDDFEVRYTDTARDDLLRLFDFLLARAQTAEDFDAVQLAIDTITTEVESHLRRAPEGERQKARPDPDDP